MNPSAAPTPSATTASKRSKTDDAALTELRNATATYDHLRGRGERKPKRGSTSHSKTHRT